MIQIEQTLEEMKSIFLGSSDLFVRKLVSGGTSLAFVFLDGLTDKDLLERDILRPLLQAKEFAPPYAETLRQTTFFSEEIKQYDTAEEICTNIAQGDIALVIDGAEKFYLFSLRKYNTRSIVEPPSESVSRGPREGFIEDMKTNVSLIRRKIRSPKLVVDTVKVGKYSSTPISICYINGVVDDNIVSKVKERISKIDIDGIIDSDYIARFLEERKFSIFSQVAASEKPDIIAAKMLEGRLCVIVDGSPVVLTLPYALVEDLQDSYDYYNNSWRSSMVRAIRLMGGLLTVLLPGAYVALQSYHYQMLPLKFLLTLLSSIKGLPFTPEIEMLIVLVLFEILSQASIRMPRLMGVSLSIVGAIVLGDTAVKAGIISSPAVLVTALSAIGIFCIPDQVAQMSILRFAFLCVSAVLGLYGILFCLIILVCYLASINGYGTPFLAPFAPVIVPDLKDSIIVDSVIGMKKRPFSFPNKNRNRQPVEKTENEK
ncbi:MAG: spore germination protein [Clostridia bacterium]|nr:spore germination protein [Clostridia bacterium]